MFWSLICHRYGVGLAQTIGGKKVIASSSSILVIDEWIIVFFLFHVLSSILSQSHLKISLCGCMTVLSVQSYYCSSFSSSCNAGLITGQGRQPPHRAKKHDINKVQINNGEPCIVTWSFGPVLYLVWMASFILVHTEFTWFISLDAVIRLFRSSIRDLFLVLFVYLTDICRWQGTYTYVHCVCYQLIWP